MRSELRRQLMQAKQMLGNKVDSEDQTSVQLDLWHDGSSESNDLDLSVGLALLVI